MQNKWPLEFKLKDIPVLLIQLRGASKMGRVPFFYLGFALYIMLFYPQLMKGSVLLSAFLWWSELGHHLVCDARKCF